MNYIKQIITVTRWEYSRFFKPKNEAIGIIIMLLLSGALYFGGKYALSESMPEIKVLRFSSLRPAKKIFLSKD
jgi:hypothetical protein